MVRYWQEKNGRLESVKKDEIDKKARLWVDARNVTQEEIAALESDFSLDPELLLDVLDPDELSRIEEWDDCALSIMRLPVFNPGADVCYTTAPLGAAVFSDKIITVCWTDCEVLRDIAANRIKGLTLNDFPAFVIRTLARADAMFLRYLKEINRRTISIQDELHESIENAELLQLLNIEKSLTYFTTSLKSNQLLLEKIRRTKILKLDIEDKEWLDDVEIDNRQAMEMAATYSQITSGIMDAVSSLISNNMNVIMKKLTVISLVMMVISFITSFWGMNIRLPWSGEDSWSGFFAIIAICALSATASYLLLNLDSKTKNGFLRRKRK